MQEVRQVLRNIIFGATLVVVLLLVFRFIFVLLAVNTSHFIPGLVFTLTDPLLIGLTGLGWQISFGGLLLEFTILIAIAFYILLGLFISGIIGAVVRDDPVDIFVELIDIMFKLFEFLLLTRFLLRLFAVHYNQVSWGTTVYDATDWARGLLPEIRVGEGVIELSTLLVLGIVVVIDLTFEALFAKYIEPRIRVVKEAPAPRPVAAMSTPVVVQAPAPQPIFIQAPAPQPIPQPQRIPIQMPQSQPQTITINVPLPPANKPS